MTRDSKAALAWIVCELTRRNIPFALVGGIAAMAYGGSRPLNDIDIDVPDTVLDRLGEELREFVVFGPERSISDCFDCYLLGLSYLGQDIELSGANITIRDRSTGEWKARPTDLREVENRVVLGVEAPVMRRERLISYKKLAGRDSDLIDVREISL